MLEKWEKGLTGKKHVEFESDHNTREGDSKSYVRVGPLKSTLIVTVFPPFPAAKVGAKSSILFPTLFYFIKKFTIILFSGTLSFQIIFIHESFLICIIKVEFR